MLLEICENLQVHRLIGACMVVSKFSFQGPSSFTTSAKREFLNSVPLSVSNFLLTPNGKTMWFLHAVMISLADLFFKGIQN